MLVSPCELYELFRGEGLVSLSGGVDRTFFCERMLRVNHLRFPGRGIRP